MEGWSVYLSALPPDLVVIETAMSMLLRLETQGMTRSVTVRTLQNSIIKDYHRWQRRTDWFKRNRCLCFTTSCACWDQNLVSSSDISVSYDKLRRHAVGLHLNAWWRTSGLNCVRSEDFIVPMAQPIAEWCKKLNTRERSSCQLEGERD